MPTPRGSLLQQAAAATRTPLPEGEARYKCEGEAPKTACTLVAQEFGKIVRPHACYCHEQYLHLAQVPSCPREQLE